VYAVIGDWRLAIGDSSNRQSPIANRQSLPQPPYDDFLRCILASYNVASKEWVIRQYDHEVQAGSVIKPLVGAANDGPSDAAVVRPVLTSNRGLVIACGMNPRYGDLDPYWMAASAIDEAVRNCVAVGADPSRIAILDNFCWGNTDRPETLGTLVRAAHACHDVAIAYGTPFISGKDSLNNEFTHVDAAGVKQTVVIPPSLLITALGQMDDVNRAVSMDLKEPGNVLYLVGATRDELGGSHWEMVRCQLSVVSRQLKNASHNDQSTADNDQRTTDNGQRTSDRNVPRVDVNLAPRIFAAVHEAIVRGLVRSCHDLSEGGLAVALAEMAFAGELGVDADLERMAAAAGIDDPAVLLFSESNTRFLLEVPPAARNSLESLFPELPLVEIGVVTDGGRVRIRDGDGVPLIDSAWSDLKAAWKRPLAWD
jgi:phosphoribosylformylglycinamidine synthase